jgi:class 3 adenylate cyclase
MRKKFYSIIHELEASMGPETGRLELRTGIHSGAVTAGVIRGYNARFQVRSEALDVA